MGMMLKVAKDLMMATDETQRENSCSVHENLSLVYR